MAYRKEKEANGHYAIVIDGWENGVASDPYSGLNRVSSADLETPGEVACGYQLTNSTTSGGGSSLGQPIARSTRFFTAYGTPTGGDGSAKSYAILDANGRVWESTSITGTFTFLSSGNSTTGSTSNDGVAYYLGYLFKTRGANIDYWDGSTWHTAWQTSLTTGVKHFMYVSDNNTLYITNGANLASVIPNDISTFDPATSSTYTFSATAIATGIPSTDVALSLTEIGTGNSPQSTLLIGGSFNAIYPWDKISQSYSLPIYVADPYIGKMVSVNQNAFIFPGKTAGRGRIYITNGSQAELYYKIPDYLFNEQDPYFQWGDAIFHRNNLMFGIYPLKNSGSGAIYVQFISDQLWALNLETKALRGLGSLPTNGSDATNASVLIAATNPNAPGFSFIFGSYDGSNNYQIGYSATTSGTTTDTFPASIITDRMPVGSFLQKGNFENVEFKLRTPMAANETISVTPITEAGTGSSLTFSPTPTTGSLSAVAPVNFQANQWLQFEIRLLGKSATSGVRLREMRLR